MVLGATSFAFTPLPYFCGFEDTIENDTWELNTGINGMMAHNKWAIDTALSKLGAKSLYVSEDSGATSSFNNTNIQVVCYKTFDFDIGTYNLSFDYLVGGSADQLMQVCFVPFSQTTNSSSTSVLPWLANSKLVNSVAMESEIYNHSSWSQFQTVLHVSVSGQYKLVFIWSNNCNSPYNCRI